MLTWIHSQSFKSNLNYTYHLESISRAKPQLYNLLLVNKRRKCCRWFPWARLDGRGVCVSDSRLIQ